MKAFASLLCTVPILSSLVSSTNTPSNAPTCAPDLARIYFLKTLIDPSGISAGVDLAALAAEALKNNESESQPNPIAKDFPTQITGSINATNLIIPIDYRTARSAIPAKYPILNDQIREYWPDWKPGKYPVSWWFWVLMTRWGGC